MAPTTRSKTSVVNINGNGKKKSTNGAKTEAEQPQQQQQPLAAAPPPWHAVAAMGLCAAYFCRHLPSWETIDELAVTETFTRSVFPDFISVQTLGLIRAAIAVVIWATSIHTLVFSSGWVQTTSYLPHSKLLQVDNALTGIRTMFPFTSVSWNLLGAAFTSSSYICLATTAQFSSILLPQPSTAFLRMALLTWQVAAPNTLLVTVVVRYVIWPGVLKTSGNTVALKAPRNVLMHNVNVLFALLEVAFLGSLPVTWTFVSLAPLLGIMYVVVSWNVTHIWNTASAGPQFIYFFLDTTLGITTTVALLTLLSVLLVFYSLFVSTEYVMVWMDGSWLMHAFFVASISSAVMRFRD